MGGTECGIWAARIRENFRKALALLVHLLVGRPGLDPGTLGLKGHRVHYSLFIKFREPHIHRVLRSVRSVRSVAIEKC
jgi:hypothetical protein